MLDILQIVMKVNNNAAGKVLVLHASNLNSILVIPYNFLSPKGSASVNTKPETNIE